MRSIGLDVGKHFAEIAVHEPGGGVRSVGRVAVKPDELRAFAGGLGPDDQVALEASFNTWPIAELLAEHAGRVVVSNPLRTRAIADARIKTDTVDAATLAQLLAADFLPEVWQPDSATSALRRRVAHRARLVQERTRLRNGVNSILLRQLVEVPVSDLFGRRGRAWLEELLLPAEERERLESGLRLVDAIDAEIAAADRSLAAAALGDARVRRLLTIPGVGPVTALALISVIGDVSRFPRPNKLVAYVGLDPRVRQSGGRPAHTGHISRAGQAHTRGLLVEAAHATVRSPGPLHGFYERLRHRRGSSVAIVAVARKLTVLAWHLLTKETDYRWVGASRTDHKLHALELRSGAPHRRPRRSAPGEVSPSELRAREREVQVQAELDYRELVRARAKDAAATTGERHLKPRP